VLAKALGVLAIVTAVYVVMTTLYVVAAVANGLPAGIWMSVTIGMLGLCSATLAVGAVLLLFRNRYAGLVFKPSSFALAIIGCVLTVQAFRVADNLPLAWWLLMLPTLLAILCATGSIALRTEGP
jgi:hypothetical protein